MAGFGMAIEEANRPRIVPRYQHGIDPILFSIGVAAAGLFPTCLIDMFGRRLLHRLLSLGVGGRQGDAHFLFQIADGAQGDRHVQDRLDEFLNASPAGMQDAAEKGQRGRQAGTTNVVADVVGNLSPGDVAAVETGAGMRLILGHLYGDHGQLDDLMPAGLGVVGRRRLDHGGLKPLQRPGHKRVTFLQWYRLWLDDALRQL